MTQQTAIATDTWTVDPAHTLVEFGVKHMMVSTVKGRFSGVEGTIEGNPDEPQNAQVAITIDAASITTHNEQRDGHLRSADFLDTERFPAIRFTSTDIAPRGGEWRVTGDLTIRGVTRPAVLEAEINGRGRTPYGKEIVGISAHTKINRRDFGLVWNVALETGGVLVGDNVNISIELEAVRRQPGQ
jgi:polyisoprenoid-binding protein YceI